MWRTRWGNKQYFPWVQPIAPSSQNYLLDTIHHPAGMSSTYVHYTSTSLTTSKPFPPPHRGVDTLRSTTLNFILTNIMTTDEILNHVYECISVIPYGTNDGLRSSCPVAWPTRRYVILSTHPEQPPRRTTFSSKTKLSLLQGTELKKRRGSGEVMSR